MARIRYLKPDFFKDEDIKELPFEVRIFYEGLWCMADREGRLEERPERLKVEIMPYDEIDIEKALTLLALPKKHGRQPFINRYVTDKQRFIQIINWHKHQKPHHTEKESTIPPPSPLFNGSLTGGNGEGNGEGNGKGNGKGNGDGNSPNSLTRSPEPGSGQNSNPTPSTTDIPSQINDILFKQKSTSVNSLSKYDLQKLQNIGPKLRVKDGV
ncbi:MAG: hypothetical protein PHH14_02280 [Candidatus Margulisbacteria bacterium]|nr:hypothetical protein [Candidatus Margulisiibacteriota bacterium]